MTRRKGIRLEFRYYDQEHGWSNWFPMRVNPESRIEFVPGDGILYEIRVLAMGDNLELLSEHYPAGMREVMRW